jgi:hypothetical protein
MMHLFLFSSAHSSIAQQGVSTMNSVGVIFECWIWIAVFVVLHVSHLENPPKRIRVSECNLNTFSVLKKKNRTKFTSLP